MLDFVFEVALGNFDLLATVVLLVVLLLIVVGFCVVTGLLVVLLNSGLFIMYVGFFIIIGLVGSSSFFALLLDNMDTLVAPFINDFSVVPFDFSIVSLDFSVVLFVVDFRVTLLTIGLITLASVAINLSAIMFVKVFSSALISSGGLSVVVVVLSLLITLINNGGPSVVPLIDLESLGLVIVNGDDLSVALALGLLALKVSKLRSGCSLPISRSISSRY